MRETKFKAIYQSPHTDEPNKILVSEPIALQEIFHSTDTQIDFTDGSYLRFHEMEERYTKWVQFTGLLDKNNTEVYEGDIVAVFDFADSSFRHEVVYAEGAFGYKGEITDDHISFAGNHNFEFWKSDQSQKIEVIGNTHSNPELLEQP